MGERSFALVLEEEDGVAIVEAGAGEEGATGEDTKWEREGARGNTAASDAQAWYRGLHVEAEALLATGALLAA